MESNISKHTFQTPERHSELSLDEIKACFSVSLIRVKEYYNENQKFEILVDSNLYKKFDVKNYDGCKIVEQNLSPGNYILRPITK